MGYRYCPECEKWYTTAEYTVDDHGETVCRKDGHGATQGFILSAPVTEMVFRSDLPNYYDDREKMIQKARDQGLIE